MTRAVTTAIGLPPQGTIKVSQMGRVRKQARSKAGPKLFGPSQANAVKVASRLRSQRAKSLKASEAVADECPARAVLEAAMAGDRDAVTRAVNLYGSGWREMARRLLGQE